MEMSGANVSLACRLTSATNATLAEETEVQTSRYENIINMK